MADQLGAGILNAYGGGVDSTPALDGLAAEGVRFDRCYAHAAVCAPNRATIFSGRSVEIHGVIHNELSLTNETPTFVDRLCGRGYHTGGFGKFHLTPIVLPVPEHLDDLGFHEIIAVNDTRLGPYLDWIEQEHPEHLEAAMALAWDPPYCAEYGPEKRNILPRLRAAREKILIPRMQASDWESMYTHPLPHQLHESTFITNRAMDFMERHAAGRDENPFFCYVSYVDPHDPYSPPEPYDRMFDPDDIPDPVPMAVDEYPSKALEGSRDFKNFRAISRDPAMIRKLRAHYHGQIRLIDDQIGRMLRCLEEHQQDENTIVVFTTDHGDMIGDHGLITKGIKHYDLSARCPLIVRGPGIRAGTSARLTSSLDMYPTVCDWAGVPESERPPVEGISFADACRPGGNEDGWDAVTVRSTARRRPGNGTVASVVTRDGWRYTIFDEPGDYGEMFNLPEDPHEQSNLYHDPAWQDKRLELSVLHARAFLRASVIDPYRNYPMVDGKRSADAICGYGGP